MSPSIIRINVINEENPALIIAEHIFDDGEVWPAVFNLLPGEKVIDRLNAMIPEREAERAERDAERADAQVLLDARAKLDAYVANADAKTLAVTVGLTDAEVEKLQAVAVETVVAIAEVADPAPVVAIVP